ncbi:MAG TPA: hypothetical protein VLZ07_00480 [Syntrophales bacterium]|nr:hypothetical protein [Syntrophales bacterium]
MTIGCQRADNAESDDWVLLHSGHFAVGDLFENPDFDIYYNKTNVTHPSKDTIGVWLKRVARSQSAVKSRIKEREKLSKPTKGYENYKETLFFTQVNCTAKGIRFIRFIDRDVSGRTMDIQIYGNNEWQYYGPDELPSKWIEEFCPAKKSWLPFFK